MIKSNADFVHLHCHSEYSRFDGLARMADFVLHARKMGFRALALTDHGNIGGWIKFYQECKRKKDKKDKELLDANGNPLPTIKPILGCEFYLTRNHKARGLDQQKDGRKGNRHLLLLAKNWEGYQNICRLSQLAWTQGQAFSDPRIDLYQLEAHSKGVICSSACLGSVVNNNLLMGRYQQAKTIAGVFKDIFGDDFYLSTMNHGIEAEIAIIGDQIKLANELNVPICAENDSHYVRKEQAKSQEILMAMSSSRCIKDENRIHFPYDEFYLKSAEEMSKMYGSRPEILLNTVAIAERIEDFLKPGGMRLPKFNIDLARDAEAGAEYIWEKTDNAQKYLDEINDGELGKSVEGSTDENFRASYQFLQELADKGMKRLGWDKSKEHIDTLHKEMTDVKVAWDSNRMDFATYFLIVWNYINFARRRGIITGCGRGSGYASVLLRTLGITYGPDPLRFGLLWERFLGFDSKYFLLDSDWGFDEEEEVSVSVDDIAASDVEDERVVEEDQGGVDRY